MAQDATPRKQREDKYYEGWLEYRHSEMKGWTSYWVVLRGKTLWIFSSPRTTIREELKGSLPMNHETIFHPMKKNKNNSFGFRLDTKFSNGEEYRNTFKCKEYQHLIEWEAFIEGISKGVLSNEARSKLLPGQIELIESAMAQQDAIPPPVPSTPRPVRPSGGSSTGEPDTQRNSVSSSGSDNSLRLHMGVPVLPTPKNADARQRRPNYHMFSTDASNNTMPSWFFENCDRLLAENLLKTGSHHGNVLMRESSSFSTDGSYVIMMRRDGPIEGPTFYNYKVANRGPSGFKLEVETPTEIPLLSCLNDVMSTFITSAINQYKGYILKTMKTNDLQLFGVNRSIYDTEPPDPLGVNRTGSKCSIHTTLPDNSREQTYYNLGDYFPPREDEEDVIPRRASSVFVAKHITPSVDSFDYESEYINLPEHERKHFVPPGILATAVRNKDSACPLVTSPPRTPELLKATVPQPPSAPKPPPISSIPQRQTPVMSAPALRSPVVRNKNQPPGGDQLVSELEQKLNRRRRSSAVDSGIYDDSSQVDQSHETNSTAVHQVDFRSILKSRTQSVAEIEPENRTYSRGMMHSISASQVTSVHQQSPRSAQKSELDPTQGDEAIISHYCSEPGPILSLRDAMKNSNINNNN